MDFRKNRRCSVKPPWVTAAVAKAGGSFYTFDDNGVETTIPVFWDPTFLAKKKAMIAALGAHFSGNSMIKIVSVIFANASSEDWNVPHTPPEIAAWFTAGYSTEKMLATGSAIINATMAAFPNQYVTLAVGGNWPLSILPHLARTLFSRSSGIAGPMSPAKCLMPALVTRLIGITPGFQMTRPPSYTARWMRVSPTA